MMSVEEIFTYSRLLQSFYECRKGQFWKGSAINFQMNYAEQLLALESDIANGNYKPYPDNINYICERGKTRKINSQHIRDRIIHKIINQDILIPIFYKRFIRQNTASQINKGVDFAMKTMKCHLNRAHRKWGKDFYILSIDIRKYFENIPHWYIEKLIREEVKDESIVSICMESMRAYGGEKGIGLGSEMNQTYALLCLNELDHLIKERYRIKEYGRYMDDIYIMLDNKKALHDLLADVREYLSSIGLEVNEKKTQIFPVKNGISFLGFRWYLTDSGHVHVIPKKEVITRTKRKLRKLQRLFDLGEKDMESIARCYASIRGNLKRSSSKRYVREMDNYYNKLFIEGWVNGSEKRGFAEDGKYAVHTKQAS